jgi:hypothetical protein
MIETADRGVAALKLRRRAYSARLREKAQRNKTPAQQRLQHVRNILTDIRTDNLLFEAERKAQRRDQ